MTLGDEIRERFGTIHRFCKRYEGLLNRSTVYSVLAEKYSGNMKTQTKRIRDVLDGVDDETGVFEAIKKDLCQQCNVTHQCNRCDKMFKSAAKAATRYFSN